MVGLAISMSVGVLMILFLSEILSFDQFHENKDRIYRITSSQVFMGDQMQMATASIYIADEVKRQVPGVEDVAFMRQGLSAMVKAKNDFVSVKGYYASSSVFDVFSFKLKQGNPEFALQEPNSIVLIESVAKKLFGDENPMNQTIELEGKSGLFVGTITGILEDPPIQSHIQFESLISFSSYQPVVGPGLPPGASSDFKTSPWDCHSTFVYLLLNEQTNKSLVNQAMDDIMIVHNANVDDPLTHRLQHLSDCATSDGLRNLPGPVYSKKDLLDDWSNTPCLTFGLF